MKRVLAAVLMLVAAFPAWALESAPVSSKRAVATLVTDTERDAARQAVPRGICGCGWRMAGTPTGKTPAMPACRRT